MKTILIAAFALLISVPTASADRVRPRGNSGHITVLGAGIMELGIDNVFILKSRSETTPGLNGAPDSTTGALQATFIGGPSFRYFLMNNLSVSANVNFTVRHLGISVEAGGATSESSLTEMGALGTVMLDYYVPLGFGMFLKPGIGGGGFYASSRTPIDGVPNAEVVSSRVGGIGRLQIGLVKYTSSNFNLKASMDIIAAFGSVTDAQEGTGASTENTRDLLEFDIGWNVGFAYVF